MTLEDGATLYGPFLTAAPPPCSDLLTWEGSGRGCVSRETSNLSSFQLPMSVSEEKVLTLVRPCQPTPSPLPSCPSPTVPEALRKPLKAGCRGTSLILEGDSCSYTQ